MLGTTRLQDYNIFTSIIREDELLLKWFIRHPRRLPGHSIDRRLLLTIQMKTALETTSRAATNTLQIATDIIESFQRYIFRFSRSPNHLFWLSWGSATIFHDQQAIFTHSRTIVDFSQHHRFVEDSSDKTALTFGLMCQRFEQVSADWLCLCSTMSAWLEQYVAMNKVNVFYLFQYSFLDLRLFTKWLKITDCFLCPRQAL